VSKQEIDIFAPVEDDGWNTDENCPWCGEGISDVWEHFGAHSDDAEFECPHCEKPVHASEWRQIVLQRPRAERRRLGRDEP
jgi:hypothetical protein